MQHNHDFRCWTVCVQPPVVTMRDVEQWQMCFGKARATRGVPEGAHNAFWCVAIAASFAPFFGRAVDLLITPITSSGRGSQKCAISSTFVRVCRALSRFVRLRGRISLVKRTVRKRIASAVQAVKGGQVESVGRNRSLPFAFSRFRSLGGGGPVDSESAAREKAVGSRKIGAKVLQKPANRPPLPAFARLVRLCPPFLWRARRDGGPPSSGPMATSTGSTEGEESAAFRRLSPPSVAFRRLPSPSAAAAWRRLAVAEASPKIEGKSLRCASPGCFALNPSAAWPRPHKAPNARNQIYGRSN